MDPLQSYMWQAWCAMHCAAFDTSNIEAELESLLEQATDDLILGLGLNPGPRGY